MKKKTWILITLMYAAVFLTCFGVLYIMDKIAGPGGPAVVESSAVAAESSPSEAREAERP